jgi:hypothetical protein
MSASSTVPEAEKREESLFDSIEHIGMRVWYTDPEGVWHAKPALARDRIARTDEEVENREEEKPTGSATPELDKRDPYLERIAYGYQGFTSYSQVEAIKKEVEKQVEEDNKRLVDFVHSLGGTVTFHKPNPCRDQFEKGTRMILIERRKEGYAVCLPVDRFQSDADVQLARKAETYTGSCLKKHAVWISKGSPLSGDMAQFMLSLYLFGTVKIDVEVEPRVRTEPDLWGQVDTRVFDEVEGLKKSLSMINVILPRIKIRCEGIADRGQLRYIVTVDPPNQKGFGLYPRALHVSYSDLADAVVVRDLTNQWGK